MATSALVLLADNFEEIELAKINLSELPELEQFMLHKIYSLNEIQNDQNKWQWVYHQCDE